MWKKLNIKDSQYFVKQECTGENLRTTLSDLIIIWEETVTREDAVNRFKVLNPAIQAREEVIIGFFSSLIEEPDCDFDFVAEESSFNLRMSTILIPKMRYDFNLQKKKEESVFREITLPLILYINELKHRQDLLIHQLEAKDVEILEYKMEKFKITRKNVITSRFIKEEFEKECSLQMGERLKSGVALTSDVLVDHMNEIYPVYNDVIFPLPLNFLKRNKNVEESAPTPLSGKDLGEVNPPPKIKCTAEPDIPIKRSKVTKKRIL